MAHSIVEEIGQILPPSRNLAETLGRAASYALQQGHGEVTLEHLLLALTEDPDATLVLSISRIEVDQLKGDVSTHLGRIERRAGDAGTTSVISPDLRHILEAAAAAARGRRAEIDGAIVLAAIVGDGKSTAAHMLRAHGLTFDDAIRALQNALQASDPQMRPEAPRPVAPSPVTGTVAAPQPVVAPEPHAHHATGSTNADDILATARQRVQQRIAPGGGGDVGMAGHGDVSPTGKTQGPTRAQPLPESLQGAEDAADAEFNRIAKEIADAAGGGASEGAEAGGHGDDAGEGGRMGTSTGAALSESPIGAAKVAERDVAVAPPAPHAPIGAQPAPPGKRPLPPGAIRPHAGPHMPAGHPGPAPRDQSELRPSAEPSQSPLERRPVIGSAEPVQRPSPPPSGPLPHGAQPKPGRDVRLPDRDMFGPQGLQPHSQPANAATPAAPQPPPAHVPPARFPSAPPHQGLPGMPINRPAAANAGPLRPQAPAPMMQRRSEPVGAPGPVHAPGGAAASVERKRASEVSLGQLVENIPRVMRVGMPVVIEARIARSDVKALAEGLQGGGSVWRHELTVTKAMSLRMRAPDGGFYIETSSPETQWIENTLGLITDDYASWRWTVTPKARGARRLQLVISARTVGTDGLTAETALPDQVVAVKVRINYTKSAAKLGGWALAAVFGGVLARFGEDLPAAVAKLVGTFVK